MTASVIAKSTTLLASKPNKSTDSEVDLLKRESPPLPLVRYEGNGKGINGNGINSNGNATNGLHPSTSDVAKNRTKKQKDQHKLQHRPQQKPMPTYPLEVGWREVYDEETQRWTQQPLRLSDLLFPHESDKETIHMSQSLVHFESSGYLVEKVRPLLRPEGWLILGDVLCYWEEPGLPPIAPDLAAFYGVERPDESQRSYHVGIDGPAPDFAVEITSYHTREVDLENKPLLYAAHGVSELLIIDTQTPADEPWHLLGYRLGEGPRYDLIPPDAEGGITFETVGLRFVAIGREQVEIYEVATGLRLLTAEEQKERAEAAEALAEAERVRAEQERVRAEQEQARAEQEQARAEAEASARIQAEAQAEQERLARQDVEAQLAKARQHLRALGIEI